MKFITTVFNATQIHKCLSISKMMIPIHPHVCGRDQTYSHSATQINKCLSVSMMVPRYPHMC